MSSKGGLSRDIGCFHVANFPDQDDVGVLTEHPAKQAGEGEIDAVIHLMLSNGGQAYLHRILERDDVDVGLVDLG